MLERTFLKQLTLCVAPPESLSPEKKEDQQRVFCIVEGVLEELTKMTPPKDPEGKKRYRLLVETAKIVLAERPDPEKPYKPGLIDQGIIKVGTMGTVKACKEFCKAKDADDVLSGEDILEDIADSTIAIQEELYKLQAQDFSHMSNITGKISTYVVNNFINQKNN